MLFDVSLLGLSRVVRMGLAWHMPGGAKTAIFLANIWREAEHPIALQRVESRAVQMRIWDVQQQFRLKAHVMKSRLKQT